MDYIYNASYDIQFGNVKRPTHRNTSWDQASHEFTYSLFPHKGDFRAGRVIQEAYDLNCSLEGMAVGAGSHSLKQYSLLGITEENIFADTIKPAEDGDGIIIRLYEAYGMWTKAHITLPSWQPETVVECNCMEERSGPVAFDGATGNGLELEFKPYEIKTLRVK